MTARKTSRSVRRVVLISSSEDESMRVVGSASHSQPRSKLVSMSAACQRPPPLTEADLACRQNPSPKSKRPASARKRKRGKPEVVVEIPATRRPRRTTTTSSQGTLLAETPARSKANRRPASLPRAAASDPLQDARSASSSAQRNATDPPTAFALLQARLDRLKDCSGERLYEDMPYLDTESDLSDTESLMDWEAQRDRLAEIKTKVQRVLPAELRPFKGVLAKAGVTDTVTLKRVIKPDRVKRFVKRLSEVRLDPSFCAVKD